MGLFYDRRFDCHFSATDTTQYEPKLDYSSPHTAAIETVHEGARILDLGCAGGFVGAALRRQRRCRVTGVDRVPLGPGVELDAFIVHEPGGAGGIPGSRDGRHSRTFSAGIWKLPCEPRASRDQHGAHQALTRVVFLSDVLRGRTTAVARVPPSQRPEALDGTDRCGR